MVNRDRPNHWLSALCFQYYAKPKLRSVDKIVRAYFMVDANATKGLKTWKSINVCNMEFMHHINWK